MRCRSPSRPTEISARPLSNSRRFTGTGPPVHRRSSRGPGIVGVGFGLARGGVELVASVGSGLLAFGPLAGLLHPDSTTMTANANVSEVPSPLLPQSIRARLCFSKGLGLEPHVRLRRALIVGLVVPLAL